MSNVTVQFRYGLRMRPPSLGAVPVGFTLEPAPDDGPNTRHGVAVYERMLSPEEVRQFELVPLSGPDGRPLEVPKLPWAVLAQVTEAVEAFRYMAREIEEGASSREDFADHIADMGERLDIFRAWASRKGIGYEQVLSELGGLPRMFEREESCERLGTDGPRMRQ